MARPAGSVNRATTQRKLIAEQRAIGKPLAKEVLEEFMMAYREAALRCIPKLDIPADIDPEKLRRFNGFADKTMFYASRLAPYQSPTLRSLTVQAPRDTAMRGTPAIDALEAFVLTLAAVRRKPVEPEPVTVDAEPDVPTLIEVKRNGP